MLEVKNLSEDIIAISGQISAKNVAGLRKELEGRIRSFKQERLTIDLSKIETFDSVVVSLLLCLLRRAKIERREIVFASIPDALTAMIRVGDLESIFSEVAA